MSELRRFAQCISNANSWRIKTITNEQIIPDEHHYGFSNTLPLDYEKALSFYNYDISEDTCKEIILFPSDDLIVVRCPRQRRFSGGCISPKSLLETEPYKSSWLLAFHALNFYTEKEWIYIYQKSAINRGPFTRLPRYSGAPNRTRLADAVPSDHWFAIDLQTIDSSTTLPRATGAPSSRLSLHMPPSLCANQQSQPQSCYQRRVTLTESPSIATAPAPKASAPPQLPPDAFLAVCTGDQHATYQTKIAKITSSQQMTNQIARSYVPVSLGKFELRQLTSAEVTALGSSPRRSPSLAQHVIVSAGSTIAQRQQSNVIPLFTVSKATKLDAYWLRLDRTDTAQSFIFFAEPDTLTVWLKAINALLLIAGPTNDQSSSSASNSNNLDGVFHTFDADEISGASRRFANESELYLTHLRQKDCLSLMSVYPDIRIVFDRAALTANARLAAKSMLEPPLSAGTIPQLPQPPYPDRLDLPGWRRFLLTCRRLTSLVQFDAGGNSPNKLENPEPYFVTLFLVDPRSTATGCHRVSENFYWNPNSPAVNAMLPPDQFEPPFWPSFWTNSSKSSDITLPSDQPAAGGQKVSNGRSKGPAPAPPVASITTPQGIDCPVGLDEIRACSSGLLTGIHSLASALAPHAGAASSILFSPDLVERQLKLQLLPIRFQLSISELNVQEADADTGRFKVLSPDFHLIIPSTESSSSSIDCRPSPSIASSHGLKEGDVLLQVDHCLDSASNLAKHEAALQLESAHHQRGPFDGSSQASIGSYHSQQSSSISGSLERPGKLSITSYPTGGGRGDYQSTSIPPPFTRFIHTLYVGPRSLHLAIKHPFGRARNLSCFIEFRCNDSLESTAALKVFYSRPSARQPLFDSWFNTSVTYHESTPTFTDTAKICLPIQLTTNHHLLFRFVHISVDSAAGISSSAATGSQSRASGSRKQLVSNTGFAWLPILGPDGNLNSGTFNLSMSTDLVPGYLRSQPQSKASIQSVTGDAPAINWLDSGRPLFNVSLQPLSSIYTSDPALAKFFRSCLDLLGLLVAAPKPGSESTSNVVKFKDTKEVKTSSPKELDSRVVSTRLCNAIKSLTSISLSQLVAFLPTLIGQFLQLFLLVANIGQKWTSASDKFAWLNLGSSGGDSGRRRSSNKFNSAPGDILKTSIETLCTLLSGLGGLASDYSTLNASQSPTDDAPTGNHRTGHWRHPLLKQYVKFIFNPSQVESMCHSVSSHLSTRSSPPPGASKASTNLSSISLTLPLHHSLVRALIHVLAHPTSGCWSPQMGHLFANLWFPFALIVKSMTLGLDADKKIGQPDRSKRFSTSYCDDLTLLIRLFGLWFNSSRIKASSTHQQQSDGSGSRTGSVSSRRGNAASSSGTLTNHDDTLNAAANRHHQMSISSLTGSKSSLYQLQRELATVPASGWGDFSHDPIDGTNAIIVPLARFLGHLVNLMDRGYVLKLIWDLFNFLEVGPSMPIEEIDRRNNLSYHLLDQLCQHEFFIQLNLPVIKRHSKTASNNIGLSFECDLTETFKRDHYFVGCLLANLSCLLAGCVNTGGWAVDGGKSKAALYRLPVTLIRNALAKLCLIDTPADRLRRQMQQSLGSGSTKPATNDDKSVQLQARAVLLFLPLVRLLLDNLEVVGPPGSALQAAIQDARANQQQSSQSTTESDHHHHHRRKKGGGKKKKKNAGPSPSDGGSGGGRYSHRSSRDVSPAVSNRSSTYSSSSASSVSMTSVDSGGSNGDPKRSSATYLNRDGKVDSSILDQIAGLNEGGSLRGAHVRRRPQLLAKSSTTANGSNVKRDSDSELTGGSMTTSHSGSTLTLTDIGGEVDSLPRDSNEEDMWSQLEESFSIPEHDQTWAQQVISLAGLITNPVGSTSDSRPASVCNNAPVKSRNASNKPSEIAQVIEQSNHHPHMCPSHGRVGGRRQLTDRCQRDLFVCFLHISSTVLDCHLTALFRAFSDRDKLAFLNLLDYSIQHLRYHGKKRIENFENISRTTISRSSGAVLGHAMALSQSGRQQQGGSRRSTLYRRDSYTGGDEQSMPSSDDAFDHKAMLEANLANEVGLTVLNLVQKFVNTFKTELDSCQLSSPLFRAVIDVYLALLVNEPSFLLIRHTFAALRLFVENFASVLFAESGDTLGQLCLTGLKWANMGLSSSSCPSLVAKQPSQSSNGPNPMDCDFASYLSGSDHQVLGQIRLEACGFVHKLWTSSLQTYGKTGFNRVYLHTIISVSKLVTTIDRQFESSLNLLADLDRSCQAKGATSSGKKPPPKPASIAKQNPKPTRSRTASESSRVDDLLQRMRTVLTTTDELRQNSDDFERLVDLHYCLAKSYASNPVLRRTWLEELASLHQRANNYTEFAMTKLHIAALTAECLYRRGAFPQGSGAFRFISSNIVEEESQAIGASETVLQELSYTQNQVLTDLADAIQAIQTAGLYEAIKPIYDLILPIYEASHDYVTLASIYLHLGQSYQELNRHVTTRVSRPNLLSHYYYVAMHGKAFESLDGSSFVYRTDPSVKLDDINSRLLALFNRKLARHNVEVELKSFQFSRKVAPDPTKAFITVVFVEPYRSETSTAKKSLNDKSTMIPQQPQKPLSAFDTHFGLNQFSFQTPFLMVKGKSIEASIDAVGKKHTDDRTQQWKRLTILKTEAKFPHLRRRLAVIHVDHIDKTPLDGAIDEIENKNQDLSSYLVTANSPTTPTTSPFANIFPSSTSASSSTGAKGKGKSDESSATATRQQASGGGGGIPVMLDMKLQGALLTTVNVGPMAYAEAFLKKENQAAYDRAKIARLRFLFLQFLTICLKLLVYYKQNMLTVHEEKYVVMRSSLDQYRVDLSNLLKEEIIIDEARQVIQAKSDQV